MRSLLLTIAIFGFALSQAIAQSSSTEQRNLDEAVRVVRQESQADFPLRAALLPSLGDDVIFLKTKGEFTPRTEVPLISFYRVTPAPYELKGNKIERQTVQVDNYSEWLVAVDQESNQRFLLEGSRRNPVAEFNKLMQSLHLRIADADAALAVFDFFLKTVRGEQVRSRVVGDDMKLQSIALDDFRLRFPAAKSRAAFDAWWKGVSAATRQAIKPPIASPMEHGFTVQYFFYDRGSLRKEQLNINADGIIEEAH